MPNYKNKKLHGRDRQMADGGERGRSINEPEGPVIRRTVVTGVDKRASQKDRILGFTNPL